MKNVLDNCSRIGTFASLALFLLIGMAVETHADLIVVDTVADPGSPGECSLRDAIKSANENPVDPPSATSGCAPGNGPDRIEFSGVPGFGVAPVELNLIAGLPAITSQVSIDGSITEQRVLPGSPGRRPGVVILPTTVPTIKLVPGFGEIPYWPNGFYLKGPDASGSEIRGMVVINDGRSLLLCSSPLFNPDPIDPTVPEIELCGTGVMVFGANETTIAGNYFGLTADGLQLPTPSPSDGFGLMLDNGTTAIMVFDGSNNIIGGDTSNDRNIARAARVGFNGISATIWIDLSGWAKPAFGAPKKTNHNKVLGNYVNVDAEGTRLNEASYGIWHFSSRWADDTVFPGRVGYGPECYTSDSDDPEHCEMIGTVFKGNTVVSTATNLDFFGYSEDVLVDQNTFMTTPAGAFAYVLTVSEDPGFRESPMPAIPINMVVTNNRMGIDQNGNPAGSPLSCVNLIVGDGILIENNIVTNCGFAGILLQDLRQFGRPSVATNVTISRNSIFSNAVFGFDDDPAIDLREYGNLWGVTANDLEDADEGANNLQNYPVLTDVRFNPAVSFINGTMHGKPKSLYVIELFSNDELSLSGYGEGKKFLTDRTIKTDKNGDTEFSIPYNQVQGGFLADQFNKTYLTATATAKFCEKGNSTCKPGATSEFSAVCELDLTDLGGHGIASCNTD